MFLAFLKLVGLSLLQELLAPKPEVQHAKPSGIDSFTGPTAESGRPIPVVFGKVRQRGANLLWYGDFSTLPIISSQKIKGLFKSKTVHQITGYRYFIGLQLGLGHAGIETLHSVWAEDRLAWSGSQAFPGSIAINAPNLFGGIGAGGGLVGTLKLWPGDAAQAVDPYLVSKLGASIPAYRGRSTAIWAGGEIGTSTSLRALSFELSRYPDALGLGAIGVDANPAEIGYEVLTNAVWGLGASSDLIDAPAFTTAGTTLDSEGFGLSLIWDQRRTVGDFLTEIARHTNAVMFPDFRSAKYTMKLIRGGADPSTLPVLDPTNCKVKSYTRSALDETVNQYLALWTNRAGGYKQDAASSFNLANFRQQSSIPVVQTRQYPGISDPAIAASVADRDLCSTTIPLVRVTLEANRSGYLLEPGDVFVFRWPERSIEQVVMRITKLRPGAPGARNIEIDAVQDVFAMASSAFTAGPATEWTDPVAESEPVTLQRAEEIPYLLLTQNDGSLGPGPIDPDDAMLMITAARPNLSTLRAGVETRISPADYRERGSLEQFAPTGTLVDEYPESTDAIDGSGTLIVENLQDVDLLTNASASQVATEYRNLALLGDELIAWETITDNGDETYTLGNVWRGVLDTVPDTHAAGARVYFLSEGMTTTLDTYGLGDDVDVRLLPVTDRSTLDEGDAVEFSHVITTRSQRPIPPGDTGMNGTTWPTLVHLPDGPGTPQSAVFTGPMVVAWAHRDRLDASLEIVPQDDPDIGPEVGTTYTVRIYDEDDVLAHTEAGLSGTSYTWPLATEFAETGRYNERIRATVTAVRDGLDSHQAQSRTGDFGGYGMRYGENYGGAS